MMNMAESAAYMPHGYCLFWQPSLILLHAGSDLLIVASYFAIPVALLMVLRQRPDIRFGGLVSLFASFILLCGVTHAFGIVTLWQPIYEVQGLLKLATGIVSATTAVILFRLVPTLVAIPSPSQLQDINTRLRDEIAAHEATLAQLRAARDDLERQVSERTEELTAANATLAVAAREAVHRSSNVLSIAGSIARQTARTSPDLRAFMETYDGRLRALARATESVLRETGPTPLRMAEVLAGVLEPSLATFGARIRLEGPDLAVTPAAAQQIGLAAHELATNATKFGALSSDSGTVLVRWWVGPDSDPAADQHLTLVWQETDPRTATEAARPETAAPGFGTQLVNHIVPTMLKGRAARRFSDGGMIWTLEVPVSAVCGQPTDATAAGGASPLAGGILAAAAPA